MQSQLAAFSTIANFLRPACWHSHPCLTQVVIDGNMARFPQGAMFRGAFLPLLQVPSLRDLDIALYYLPDFPPAEEQRHISCLQELTSLKITTNASTTPHMEALCECTGALSSLQVLRVSRKSSTAVDDFTIPTTWAALAHLTSLSFWYMCVSNITALIPLARLRTLHLHCQAEQLGAVLACCAQLPSLTALNISAFVREGRELELPVEGASLPSSSSSSRSSTTLKSLEIASYDECRLADVPLQLLPGLTTLTYRGSFRAPSAFPGSQVKSLAGLEMLQTLALHNVQVTLELCW
jgi:hypothetical protein